MGKINSMEKINQENFVRGERVVFHKGGLGTMIDGTSVLWDDFIYRDNPMSSTDPKHPNISISLPSNKKNNRVIKSTNVINPTSLRKLDGWEWAK